MELNRRTVVGLLVASAPAVLWCQTVSPHTGAPGFPSASDPLNTEGPDGHSPVVAKIQLEQAKAQNSERQKRLEADTDKLLALATELKQDVTKTNKNILSVDVMKKADEIERLAKSVKDRMRG